MEVCSEDAEGWGGGCFFLMVMGLMAGRRQYPTLANRAYSLHNAWGKYLVGILFFNTHPHHAAWTRVVPFWFQLASSTKWPLARSCTKKENQIRGKPMLMSRVDIRTEEALTVSPLYCITPMGLWPCGNFPSSHINNRFQAMVQRCD